MTKENQLRIRENPGMYKGSELHLCDFVVATNKKYLELGNNEFHVGKNHQRIYVSMTIETLDLNRMEMIISIIWNVHSAILFQRTDRSVIAESFGTKQCKFLSTVSIVVICNL